MADDFSDDSSSSSSDDEFLTSSAAGPSSSGGDSNDREAMIRRKLMESFYGKTSMPEEEETEAAPSSRTSSSRDDANNTSSTNNTILASSKEPTDSSAAAAASHNNNTSSDDLDSPYFDPDAHTSQYVLQGSVHQVLQVEERLALQVRTLDSTMQTLVYENYSKFIDATDAIRSIGVSVTSKEEGLEQLSKSIVVIQETHQDVEQSLGSLRNAVAEKLRIKRLLKRLDALLKLPTTLRDQIAVSKYRLATKSYLTVYAILNKHSQGFESLKTIQDECQTILSEMVQSLKRKLLHWSGQSMHGGGGGGNVQHQSSFDSEQADEVPNDDNDHDVAIVPEEGDEDWLPPPDPPTSIAEIFECASTLLMVLPENLGTIIEKEDSPLLQLDSGLAAKDCRSWALAACIRHLERLLDSHEVALQDAMFSTELKTVVDDAGAFDTTGAAALDTSTSSASTHSALVAAASTLIPTKYLDGILEAATLYGISFAAGVDEDESGQLWNFVRDAYGTFLSHVKSILLERSSIQDYTMGMGESGDVDVDLVDTPPAASDDEDDDGDASYLEISQAMTHLLRSVRDLASGLALPDVAMGVDANQASSLVEEAVNVTETMVQRRVAQKFYKLRIHVLQDCLRPFCQNSMVYEQPEQDEGATTVTPRVTEIVQMASVALSDGLQFIDDTVKSILTGGTVVAELKGVDYAMVKAAVEKCCRRFALWLAVTLELLAGCERADPDFTVDAAEEEAPDTEEMDGSTLDDKRSSSIAHDDVSEVRQDAISEKIESILQSTLQEMDESGATEDSRYDFLLAVTEMCRLAQRSVMDNVNQSINATASGSRRHQKNTDIFASSNKSSNLHDLSDRDAAVSERFLLAASRIITLYAMNRGADASLCACQEMYLTANEEDDDDGGLPSAPQDGMVNVLAVAKQTSLDCFVLFGGDEKCASPLPDAPEDEEEAYGSSGGTPYKSNLTSNISKGLQLDVERMFTEKMATYPHPSNVVEFTRNAIVFLVFKVTLNALTEHARTCTFSTKGYRQLQVDVFFLRHYLPHYVKDEVEGVNALTILDNSLNDAMTNAGERCKDLDCVGQTKFYNPVEGQTTTLQSIVRVFMEDDDEEEQNENEDSATKPRHVKHSFVIEEDASGA